MSDIGSWILGAVMAVLSLLGLIMASQAQDDAFYFTGLLFFVFGVLFIFALIKRCTGAPSAEPGPAESGSTESAPGE